MKTNIRSIIDATDRSILVLIFSLCAVACASDKGKGIQFEYVDPLEKVTAEATFFRPQEALSEVVRGEHATLQFVVRATDDITDLRVDVPPAAFGGNTLPAAKTGFVGYVKVGRSVWNSSRDRIVTPSGYYPDPILEVETVDVPFGNAQAIWISIPVPTDAAAGEYDGRVTISGNRGGKRFSISKPYRVKVYPVTVERTSLWVTNWFSLAANSLKWMNGGEPVEEFSEQYWTCVEQLAEKMAEYRQNMALISPLRLSSHKMVNGEWTVDFSNFDRMVELFIRKGVVGRIEGGHIGARVSHWSSPFAVFVPNEGDGNELEKFPISDPRAKKFYTAFIPALTRHLEEKGWSDIYCQHIADEPINSNADTYVEIANFVKRLAPDLPIIEACHSKDLVGTVDVWVPQLNYFDSDLDFYKEQAVAGKEVWFYTCLDPKGEYANRFIELPLLKTRYVHWLNYKYDVPGYLHWGLNYWRSDTDPFDEQTSQNHEGGNILPGGDSWIIYPGDGRLYSSIRADAMRDGIVDYELFRMIEKRDPVAARAIVDVVIYGFERYDNSVEQFRRHRRHMMELLSE